MRPIRARTPGVSFIWPNTSTVLSNTPESCIFVPEVVAFPGALAHASEDGYPLVNSADVADKLLNDYGLAHTGPTIGAHLATLGEGGNQVKDLDARLQNLNVRVLVVKCGSVPVNRPPLP